MMKYKLILPALAICCILFLTSCNENSISSTDIVFPDSGVSFQNHVYPFLKVTCSYQGCHSDETQAGGRRMTDYYTLFETANLGLVIANDTLHSRLYQMVTGKAIHTQVYLPLSISANHKQGIARWILEGALNN